MKRLYRLSLFLCLLSFIPLGGTDAETWVEDFNEGPLNSWSKHDDENRSTWQPIDGKLDVWVQPRPPPGLFDRYPLEFTGFRFDVEKINVKVRILETRNANVGILIGRYNGQEKIEDRTVKFFDKPMFGSAIWIPDNFQGQNKVNKPNNLTYPLDEIEIAFNNGHFKLFSQNEPITEFQVPQLPTIDCIGVMAHVWLGEAVIAHFVLDDFVISGPTIPAHGTLDVRPPNKAAVLWGELKRE